MYMYLGWFSIALIVVMTSPFWLRVLNNRTLRLKGGAFGKTLKVLRSIHKPLGAATVIITLIHGYLALGAIRLHTGLLVWLSLLVTAALGISFYFAKKKTLFVWHKRMVLVVIFFLLIHLFFPGALYYLLR